MTTITRRAALLGSISAAAFGLTACTSSPPMDEKQINDTVAQVDGVTSVNITIEESGIADWSLKGEIGLPDDPTQARTVYENCLRAIAGIPTESNVGIYVYGRSATGELDPSEVGAPGNMSGLKKHFS